MCWNLKSEEMFQHEAVNCLCGPQHAVLDFVWKVVGDIPPKYDVLCKRCTDTFSTKWVCTCVSSEHLLEFSIGSYSTNHWLHERNKWLYEIASMGGFAMDRYLVQMVYSIHHFSSSFSRTAIHFTLHGLNIKLSSLWKTIQAKLLKFHLLSKLGYKCNQW